MRRRAGAIFRESRPATIIRSDCRGLPRNTSAPKRAMSYREALIAIISIAQHARPKVTGQIDERRAHCTIFSTVVVSTGISVSIPIGYATLCLPAPPPRRRQLVAPVERAFPPDVDVAEQQQDDEEDHLPEPGPAQIA